MSDINETATTGTLDALIESGRKFHTILADPPWHYQKKDTRGSASNHYRTMPTDQIADLPVSMLAADQCHLHLWTTNAFLQDALELIDRWGFEFASTFVWTKPQLGLGNYWRCSHEILLLGVKGDLPFMVDDAMSWVEAPRRGHSAKPNVIRKLIERVSPGPRLEMFARQIHDGWISWGDQIHRGMFDADVPELTTNP